ncbi:MAG: response regulator [Pseudobutyrivibrio sp.]|nr:response regulator [Pseudobutyrivibrio sp.]
MTFFRRAKKITAYALVLGLFFASYAPITVKATVDENTSSATSTVHKKTGGGYAVTGQINGVGYTTELYNAGNGLPTSDANCVLADSMGYVWIGGYSGIIRCDGTNFERLDSSDGLTSGKTLFEDSKGRIWVGTNDNGIVLLDGTTSTHYTYKDGLPASTIRAFAEGEDGTIYVGTTSGLCFIDEKLKLHRINNASLDNEYIIRMMTGAGGIVYGNTRNGHIFSITGKTNIEFYKADKIGIGDITAIYANPSERGKVFLGNHEGKIYYGNFGASIENLRMYDVSPAMNVSWISYECNRLWVIAENEVGYFGENNEFQLLENLPLDSSIEMITEDYQGNLWLTSTRQGVAKIVTNNFENLTKEAGLEPDVVNATCLYHEKLYIGTDNGLQILDDENKPVENELTEHLKETRIRCIINDKDDNIWICAYNNNKGLIRYNESNGITSYTEETGFIDDGVRCCALCNDGSIIVGTNEGVAIVKNGEIGQIVDESKGMLNTMVLTLEQGGDDKIYVGTDGDGIYEIASGIAKHIGREEGLTSDVILRIRWDKKRQLYWIITSNSIQYMKDGEIYEVKNFPYSNNFDIYFDSNDNAWIMSSIGIYCVEADSLIEKEHYDYKLYDTSSGLASIPTGNAFCAADQKGNLFIAGREGVCKVNIDRFYNQSSEIKVGIKRIVCNDQVINLEEDGTYVIPAGAGRIQIAAAIINYTLSNPLVHMYLEGAGDQGITENQINLTDLEYTDLKAGNYTLHIQLVDESSGSIYQDETFTIIKKPSFMEITAVRILLVAIITLLIGLMVWRIMSTTIIRRQYKEIQAAKDEVERANTAKSRFLANMSHEIRTPINTIMGMDEMMLREDSTGVPKEYLKAMTNYARDIKAASASLLSLINNLLDLSKIESGKMNLVEQEYSLEDQVRSMVKMIRVRSDEKNLKFDLDIDENIPSKLFGDSAKIRQVVLNLLTNAVKYTDKGGFTLKIFVAEIKGDICKLCFSVKDTGIGVKEEDKDRLFMAFERLDERKNSGVQGTGLGLDISRQFAELMDGVLTCDSVYGEGSEFKFVVEQNIIDATPMGAFKEEIEEKEVGPYKPLFVAPDAAILVVDDNPKNLEVVKGLLAATKIFVSTATSGEECLDKLKESTFNVVLLDHLMPGMDGIETCERIRKRYPDLPVYAFTANTESEDGSLYADYGFNGYLAKPIDAVLLEKTILKHLPDNIVMV